MKIANHFAKEKLVHCGTCFGKFTKTQKFRIHVSALEYLSKLAVHKVWVKPSGELSYLYGNNVIKGHLARMTEGIP